MNKTQYTNIHKLPLSMAVFLAHDNYDGINTTNHISATSLLKSIKQYVLSQRIEQNTLIDISNNINSAMGTAYHTAVENAWKSPNLDSILESLNVPKRIRNNIKINPTKLNKNDIPIYMEQRASKQILDWIVSGKFDLVMAGTLEDIKSTSVFTYLNQLNKDKYILQGSIYRWLNPEIITDDYMIINYLFTDWSASRINNTQGYPPTKIYAQKFKLLSIKETEQFIKNKLVQLSKYMDKEEQDIPVCTSEELWRKPSIWKYYSKPDALRSTKNFDNAYEANLYLTEKNKGIVEEVKGEVVACKYCPAFNICKQKDVYLKTGDLKL